ncbi:MAG: hypothetical protein IJX88_06275 [Clostridia bacterium]|nr:hypothetical protein [Clostridia bacterium]
MKTALLAGIAALMFPFSAFKEGNLKEITKPYLGEYECKNATLGNVDLKESFKSIVLELCSDNTFILTVKDMAGKKHVQTGKYSYDEKTQTLCFCDKDGKGIQRETSLKEGKFSLNLGFDKKTVILSFEQK